VTARSRSLLNRMISRRQTMLIARRSCRRPLAGMATLMASVTEALSGAAPVSRWVAGTAERHQALVHGGVEVEPVLELLDGVGVVGRRDLHPVLADTGLEVLRRVDRDDLPVVDDGDAVAVLRLVHVVRREEDRDVLAPFQVVDVLPDRGPGLGVEANRRLVEEQHAGGVQQAAGDLQAALHAARVGADHGPAPVPQVHHVEDELHPRVQLRPGHAVQVGVEPQVLLAGQVAVERRVLEHQADVPADRVPLPPHVVSGHPRGPRGGIREGAQDLDRG
jgi:hypothetical protein